MFTPTRHKRIEHRLNLLGRLGGVGIGERLVERGLLLFAQRRAGQLERLSHALHAGRQRLQLDAGDDRQRLGRRWPVHK